MPSLRRSSASLASVGSGAGVAAPLVRSLTASVAIWVLLAAEGGRSVRNGRRRLLPNQFVLVEPFQREGPDHVRGSARGDQLRDVLAGRRSGLEAVGAPAHVQ